MTEVLISNVYTSGSPTWPQARVGDCGVLSMRLLERLLCHHPITAFLFISFSSVLLPERPVQRTVRHCCLLPNHLAIFRRPDQLHVGLLDILSVDLHSEVTSTAPPGKSFLCISFSLILLTEDCMVIWRSAGLYIFITSIRPYPHSQSEPYSESRRVKTVLTIDANSFTKCHQAPHGPDLPTHTGKYLHLFMNVHEPEERPKPKSLKTPERPLCSYGRRQVRQ
ncbi:hypothetical protein BCR39DRAFT_529944 [Naematelia encephala]|uniref:Uncharacterized protein n=1 Tax=Naematelia encephala TaxID=71784 RepID=A0A1Y2B5T3_9TREE|nr:hypothetical protein BCR39DRAFT_529944 [Naematelia encephala]